MQDNDGRKPVREAIMQIQVGTGISNSGSKQ